MSYHFDINFWGEISVPVGILICFGPALFAAAFGSQKDVDTSGRGKPRG